MLPSMTATRRLPVDARGIARWRLRSLGLTGAPFPSPVAVVDELLGVQAENHRQAAWAVACRATPLGTEAGFAERFDGGEILRTHVLRPTWHFVTPADIRWLLELTGPRIRRTTRQAQRELGMDDVRLERASAVIETELAGGRHRTRAELAEALGAAGFPTSSPAMVLTLLHAELSALVCSGPMRAREQTYALLDERAPVARRLDREEALAELALRYVTGHGPVTERDLAYWATLTLTDVRAGLAAVTDHLERFEHDGRTFWYAPPAPEDAPPVPRGHLLLTLDEYHNGYQDSRSTLDVDGVVPPGRGGNVGMALVDGQMVGDLRRTVGARTVTFEVGAFRELAADELDALGEAGRRCGRFLELDAEVVVTRR
jgi:hypothetical protein